MLPCRACPHEGPLVAGFRNVPIRDYDVPDRPTLGLNGHSTRQYGMTGPQSVSLTCSGVNGWRKPPRFAG